ncbi:MAG: hypothetical protein LQ343_007617 [Gyalolechia ehrenbergii]|nr:MAG: hypothetical protein LQ343_007617 [Gyalolechia ehrenbergii]
MAFYQINLFAFVLLNCSLIYRQHRQERAAELSEKLQQYETENLINVSLPEQDSALTFKKLFFPVYILVWAADWLQGPFIYTLYKDEKLLPEAIVARLFTTGFLAGAASGFFVGSLADRYGRRSACMVCCATTVLSCLSVQSNDIHVLFVGRALGGLGTTLMYTVFEAWMVTEYNQRGLQQSSLKLTSVFGTMITLSSIVAVAAGLLGQVLVSWTGTNRSPFIASILCLLPACSLIWRGWSENYGDSGLQTHAEIRKPWKLLLGLDLQILTLGLTSCCFEGSMYLFIFFWSPALKSSHALAHHNQPSTTLPFGLIFACFMGAMMCGSQFFTAAMASQKWLSCGALLQIVVTVGSVSLLSTIFFREEFITFWCFCLFEACVGMYFPAMGYQKGKVIDDGQRAHLYGLLRIPYNLFVVIALSLTQEGRCSFANLLAGWKER